MPPKKALNKNGKNTLEIPQPVKNSISNLFSKIQEKDSQFKECPMCNEKIKSCLLKDHLATKCCQRMSQIGQEKEEVIFMGKSKSTNDINQNLQIEIKKESIVTSETKPLDCVDINFSLKSNEKDMRSKKRSIVEIKSELIDEVNNFENEELNEVSTEKRRPMKKLRSEDKEDTDAKSNQDLTLTKNLSSEDDHAKLDSMDTFSQNQNIVNDIKKEKTQYSNEFDFYLINFTNAIQSVIAEETFACLLNSEDVEIIEKFSNLQSNK
jgi:hypothetical protein